MNKLAPSENDLNPGLNQMDTQTNKVQIFTKKLMFSNKFNETNGNNCKIDCNDNSNSEQLKKHLSKDSIEIEFKNLSYHVELGIRRGTKKVLNNIHGKFAPNQLISIMGPSGAGKSSLLDVISGYKISGVEGSLLVNGIQRDLKIFRKNSCYITQEDRLQTLLTVQENMQIVADLKLGTQYSPAMKQKKITEILKLLGLFSHKGTLTGKLSGGQKKRLSIALELINNPTVMFLDEPTTGLDSYSCQKVIDLLRDLAHEGRTIICTIHQPSAKIFQEFDQVYVLSSGYCLYQGSPIKMVEYLNDINIPCPLYHNPADYIIELASEEYGKDKNIMLSKTIGNGKSNIWLETSKNKKLINSVKDESSNSFSSDVTNLEYPTFWYQFFVLIRRGLIKAKRDTTLTHLRIQVNIFVAIALGMLYTSAGNEGSRILDTYNLLMAVIIHNAMNGMMLTVLTFPIEMGIIKKETFNRYYTLKSYYFSATLLEIPVSAMCCLIFNTVLYGMSSQPLEWTRFSKFMSISFLLILVGQSGGLIIGAWFDVVNAVFFAPIVNIPVMMFSGHSVNLRDLPFYLKWGSHFSYMRYGLEGYVSAIFGDNRARLDCNLSPYCHYRYPEKFLDEMAMDGNRFWTDVIILMVHILVFRVIAYYSLKYKIYKNNK